MAVSRPIQATLAVAALTLAFVVYQPGLNGPFLFDDYANLVKNPGIHIDSVSLETLWQSAMSGRSGPGGRPISMATFGVDHARSGMNAGPMKLTNLLIHGLNFAALLLLGIMGRGLLAPRARSAAMSSAVLLTASVWLLHPLNVSTVLYVVQRMTELSALFTLLGLACYLFGRRLLDSDRLVAGSGIAVGGLGLFTILGILSKENGVLLLGYALVTELFLLREPDSAKARRLTSAIRWMLTGGLVLAALFIAVLEWKSMAGSYAARDFNLAQRLLTEARIIFWYLGLIIVPSIHEMGLVHDDIAVSDGLLSPVTTMPAVLGIFLLLAVIWFARKRQPLISFAVAWFLVGHSLESTFIPLDLAYEHRNYLPMVGPLFAASVYLAHALSTPARKPAVALLLAVWPMVLAGATYVRASNWSSTLRWAEYQVAKHPESATNRYFLGSVFATMAERETAEWAGDAFANMALTEFDAARKRSPDMVSAYVASLILQHQMRKAVDGQLLASLHDVIDKTRFPPSAVNALMDVPRCAMDSKCGMSQDVMLGIIHGALDNPRATGRKRALLHDALGEYYAEKDNPNYEASIQHHRRASELSNYSAEFGLNLVRRLAEAGKIAQAKAALRKVSSNDPFGKRQRLIDEWRSTLARLQIELEQ